MPIRITNHLPSPMAPDPIHPSALPEEVYVWLGFDSQDTAKHWCDEVSEILARPLSDGGSLDRIVLWAPERSGSSVYVSVLGMRIVRAQEKRYMPVRGIVSLAELPGGLAMLIGSQVDLRAYQHLHQ